MAKKKRANGEGSLRKRKDGRWEGRYTAGNDPTTGKPIHKSVLAKTQSEAKEKLKQAIAEAEKLDMSCAKSYTLGAWIKLWYEVYAEPRLREKTKDYYLNYIDNHIIPELGNTPLEKLTTIQIQKFYNDLQKSGRIQRYTHIKLKDKGLSTRVVRGIHTLLNNCLEQAVAERLLLTNPAKGCRLPKLEKREMKILPEDKIGPYLAEAERRGLLAAFYLELTTGLRRGELLALLWTDLDVENMTTSVSKQVNRINGELVVSQPKTPNSVRKLAIPQRAVELLAESVEVPIIPRCLHQGLGPADQQHHGPGGGAGVDDADLLFRVLLQHHLPGDAGRVIRAGELGGKREADGTVPPLKGPGKVGGGGAGGRGGSLLHRHGGEQGGNRQGVIVHKFPAAHLDAQGHGLKPDAAAVEGSCPQVAAAVAHNIPCHKEHPEI